MKITLPYKFTPREYQKEPYNVCMDPEFKRGMLVVPRRNGKDLLCWNVLIAKAMQRTALYFYMAPYYNQVRQIIWEGYDGTGRRFLDYIPQELVKSKTKLDMRIDLINGSQIKLQGSDQIDRVVGTNPYGIVFTEYSLHKQEAWEYLRPILAENGGWAIFNGTPRGQNHFWDLYQYAQQADDWYVQHLSRDDTGVPTLEAIEDDRRSGMPEALIQQEYYTSWTAGNVGSYYSSYIEAARENNRITSVPYEPALPVYTFWDLGVGDSNAIWFAQIWGREYRFIDYVEGEGEGMLHYIRLLKEDHRKDYIYAEHWAPWDIEIREYTTGRSRKEIAADHGIIFQTAPKLRIDEGIEAVRNVLPMCWFDEKKTYEGLHALMNYQKTYNEKTQAYSNTPLHNWASDGADAFRTFALVHDMLLPVKGHQRIRVKRQVMRGTHGLSRFA